MCDYFFSELPIYGLFIIADHILKQDSRREFILEKNSENEAIYRDEQGETQQIVKIAIEQAIIRLCYLSSYPHHGSGPTLPFPRAKYSSFTFNYSFSELPVRGLFISAEHVFQRDSRLEFILEKISENEAIYRDDRGKTQQTVTILPNEAIIQLCYFYS